MNGTLNILYTADNNYAPFLGVSMFSLFQNNTGAGRIRVYAVLDSVSRDNTDKLRQVADRFGRELVTVDASDFNGKLDSMGIPKYRGTHSANYRLFFSLFMDSDAGRVLYLDSDTIVCGSLREIPSMDFGDACAGIVLDSLGGRYKGLLGFASGTPYFNSGVLVIEVKNWERQGITGKIMSHITDIRSAYCNPDQDLLNIALRGKVKVLGPEYNFQPVHRAYSDAAYREVYGFENYYTPEQVESARKNPVILHAYRFLGQFPWHRGSLHPDTELFDSYLARSPWKDYRKQDSKCSSLSFKAERLLYRMLPETAFLRLFACLQERSFRRQNAELLRGGSARNAP